MGYPAVYVPNETKALDGGYGKLLDLEHDLALPTYDDVVAEPKSSSWQRLKDCLPSVKDVVKLVLFSAATVIGMTFISELSFNGLGSTVRLRPFDHIWATKLAIEASTQS